MIILQYILRAATLIIVLAGDVTILFPPLLLRNRLRVCVGFLGYGFVDYDNVQAAETAIKALQAAGIQAQMAKVSLLLCAQTKFLYDE